MKTENGFTGKYGFLSNFAPHGFTDSSGLYWPTAEHYYQAKKSLDEKWQESIRLADSPVRAKNLGRICDLRPEWDLIKIYVMKLALEMKFETGYNLEV